MVDQSSARLHQALLQAGQRQVLDAGWKSQPPPQVPKVVGQNAEPQPDLIAPKPVAAQPRRLYSQLPLLDPLLCLAALVLETDNLPVRGLRVGHDEAQASE